MSFTMHEDFLPRKKASNPLVINHRRTKVICTIGPATASYESLEVLYHSGMNIVRLNMSHGDHQSHLAVIQAIKRLNQSVKYPIPILLDTQGPEIRTGELNQDLQLKEGQAIWVSVRLDDVEASSLHIDYIELVDTLKVGDKFTVDNGLINLQVLNKKKQLLECLVIDGGTLKSKRHVNLPGIRVNLPSITAKDRQDILFGMEHEIDFVALSFVRAASDISDLKVLLGDQVNRIKVIAKIEDQEGLSNVDSIIDASDGVMVARGDLGVEIPIEDLPNVQRKIVASCQRVGRRVIVATHLLESMIQNPIPTRAEVTDVANAVYEGVDAVMLSGETTVGKYPEKCVQILDRIARKSESMESLGFHKALRSDSNKQNLASASVQLAESLSAKGILVMTRRGVTAHYVTNCRPSRVPIFAFTSNESTCRRLALNRSVFAHQIEFSDNPERTIVAALETLKEKENLQEGDTLVVISDIIAGQQGVDALQIRHVPC